MKKILIIANNGFGKTGVPAVFMNIVRTLSPHRYQFDIIYFDDEFNYYHDEFLSFGGSAYFFGKKHKGNILKKMDRYISGHTYYKKTKKIIRDHGPYNAIHCFKEYMNCYFLKAAFECGVPIRIFHNNNILHISGNIINRILSSYEKKECLKYMTSLIGCSDKSCSSCFGSDYPFKVLENPYDEDKYFFSGQPIAKKLNLVQVGTYNDRKNQLFSLDVISEIKKKYRDVGIHFIGIDSSHYYLKLMKQRILELDLSNNVVFHQFDCEQKAVLDQCTYFILPSKEEPFGIVLIEAQACGIKCFTSNVIPDLANVGGCVTISLSDSPRDWAATIVRDYENNHGQRIKYDCSRFGREALFPKLVDLYNE